MDPEQNPFYQAGKKFKQTHNYASELSTVMHYHPEIPLEAGELPNIDTNVHGRSFTPLEMEQDMQLYSRLLSAAWHESEAYFLHEFENDVSDYIQSTENLNEGGPWNTFESMTERFLEMEEDIVKIDSALQRQLDTTPSARPESFGPLKL